MSEPTVEYRVGDCREVMKTLPSESVQMIVTSPPYYSLRVYAGEQQSMWQDDPNCDHEWESESGKLTFRKSMGEREQKEKGSGGSLFHKPDSTAVSHAYCKKCGAFYGSLGLEPTVQQYVKNIVEVMEEGKRVLKKDGVMFINVGDSYVGSGGANQSKKKGGPVDNQNRKQPGLKAKDLCLMPQRLVIALQEAGWWIRNDIIWTKRSVAPEPVKDRPTKCHEYIFMCTKSKRYFWDYEAGREKGTWPKGAKCGTSSSARLSQKKVNATKTWTYTGMRNMRSVWEFNPARFTTQMCKSCKRVYSAKQFKRLKTVKSTTKGWKGDAERGYQMGATDEHRAAMRGGLTDNEKERVCACGKVDWMSHYGAFPEELVRRCIKVATSEKGNCPKCGAPWVKIVNKTHAKPVKRDQAKQTLWKQKGKGRKPGSINSGKYPTGVELHVKGWKPTCECSEESASALILDPFAGTGTTLMVARKMGRSAIGIDISSDYKLLFDKMAKKLNKRLDEFF